MRRYECRPLFDPGSEELRFLPEGPRALGGGKLGWVAIQHGPDAASGSFNVLDLATLRNESYPLPGRVGFFAPTTDATLMLCACERAVVLYDTARREIRTTVCDTGADTRLVINDGQPIAGGLIFGTKHLEFREALGAIYHWAAPAGPMTMLVTGQTCSNGKHVWESDGQRWLADIDSPEKCVTRYKLGLDPARVVWDGVIADFRDGEIFPDGMRPTPDGRSIVVAFYDPRERDAGIARQYALATGDLEAEWILPGSPRVTCPEFVLLDGRVQLLFTTAVEGMPDATRRIAPKAGWLFVGDTDQTALAPMTRIPI